MSTKILLSRCYIGNLILYFVYTYNVAVPINGTSTSSQQSFGKKKKKQEKLQFRIVM